MNSFVTAPHCRVKKFLVTQRFDGSAERVAQAYLQKATWGSFSGLPFVGDPTLKSFAADATTIVKMAYQVSIDLPALAETFIDGDKMTFVEQTELHVDGSGTFTIIPDHYKSMLKASGRFEMVPFDDDYCERLIQGSVDISLGWAGKLFESPVEDAIVTGLSQALTAQADQVLAA